MHTILLSAFEPFGGMDHNPSQDLIAEVQRRLDRQELTAQAEHGEIAVVPLTLPVEFGRASELLKNAVDKHQPSLAIAAGLAAGTRTVRLERVGLNLRDARIPDNAGAQPVDQPIVHGGTTALLSTLRLKAAHRRITSAGIPAELSLSAGTYLCNEALYTLLHHTATPATRAGFVHIPDLSQPESPVTLAQAASALDLLIAESLTPAPDAATAQGAIH